MMQNLFSSTGNLDIFTTQIKSTVAAYLILGQQIVANISFITEKNLTNVSAAVIITDISSQVNLTRQNLERLEQWQAMQLARANTLLQESNNYSAILSSLDLQLLRGLLLSYNDSCNSFLNQSSNLENKFTLLERQNRFIMTRSNESEYVIAQVVSRLIVVQTDKDTLFSLNNVLIPDSTGSGTNVEPNNRDMGSGSGSAGSGNMDLNSHREIPSGDTMPMATIPSALQSLANDIEYLQQQVLLQSDHFMDATNISRFYQFAQTLNL